MKPNNRQLKHSQDAPSGEQGATTVLVAVESARVREGLVAMLEALDGFRIIAEADTDDAALQAARLDRPQLALIEPELSGCGGWWVIQRIEAEHLSTVVVALGRRADGVLARLVGAHTYVQMGTAPRDLLTALQAAISIRRTACSAAQTQHDLLSDAHTVL